MGFTGGTTGPHTQKLWPCYAHAHAHAACLYAPPDREPKAGEGGCLSVDAVVVVVAAVVLAQHAVHVHTLNERGKAGAR